MSTSSESPDGLTYTRVSCYTEITDGTPRHYWWVFLASSLGEPPILRGIPDVEEAYNLARRIDRAIDAVKAPDGPDAALAADLDREI